MFVIPGDQVPASERYGPGIQNGRALVAGKVEEHGNAVVIRNNFRRYVPVAKDMVIGVITQRGKDFYKVSLQSRSKPVRLNQLAFENATRKNKPNLVVGDVVYARVVSAERDLEAEIECYNSSTGKAAGFGHLKEGTILSVNVGFARELLFRGHPVLEQLAQKFAFEVAIGVNGRVWVKGPDAKSTNHIRNAIESANEEFR